MGSADGQPQPNASPPIGAAAGVGPQGPAGGAPAVWRRYPPVIAAVVSGCFLVLVAVLNKTNVLSFQIGGTEFDTPAVKEIPRQEICFWHGNAPPGYRLMKRQPDGVWLETQPDGMQYHHVELGRVERGPWHGVITRREENPRNEPGPVQLFISDAGGHNVLLYRPTPQAGWEYAAVLAATTEHCPRDAASPRD